MRTCGRLCPTTRIADYPEGLVAWLAAVDADAWFYTGALENHPDLVDELARIKPLWGNAGDRCDGSAARPTCGKFCLSRGSAFPKRAVSAAGLPLDGSWLCKTHRGSSGSGVWALDGPAALGRAVEEGAEFQRRLDRGAGKPAAVVYLFGQREAWTLGATEQIIGNSLMGAGPFQYAGSIGPLTISHEISEQLDTLRDLLAERFGLRGVVGVDLWIDDQRAWVLEVNPRYTASVELLERASGVSALSILRGGAGPALRSAQPSPETFGKLILFAQQEVTITPAFSGWALAQAVEEPWPAVADVPAAGEVIPSGAPVVTLFATGPEGSVESLFAERVAQVERRLYL